MIITLTVPNHECISQTFAEDMNICPFKTYDDALEHAKMESHNWEVHHVDIVLLHGDTSQHLSSVYTGKVMPI